MKKILSISFIIIIGFCGFSQDTIIKKNNDTIIVDISFTNNNLVEFSYYNESVIYTLSTKYIWKIIYEDGSVKEYKKRNKYYNSYNSTYRFIVELGTGPQTYNEYLASTLSFINGYQINEFIFTGLNLGIKNFKENSKSIYGEAYLRINFTQTLVSPYISLSYGMAYILYSNPNSPLNHNNLYSISSTIGAQYQFNDRNMINLGIGLETIPCVNFDYQCSSCMRRSYNSILCSINLGFSIW